MNHQPKIDRKNPWPTRLVIMAITALVGLPLAFYGCQSEGLHWRMAALAERYRLGDRESAIDAAWQLHREHTDNLSIARMLADWLVDSGKSEKALEICHALSEIFPNNSRLNQIRIKALMHLERYAEALDVIKQNNKLIPISAMRSEMFRRNELAYVRALADQEIDRADADISGILASLEKSWATMAGSRTSAEVLLPVIASIIYLEGEKFYEAVSVLSAEIEMQNMIAATIQQQTRSIQHDRLDLWLGGTRFPGQVMDSAVDLPDSKLTESQNHLALLYALRAKAWQEMDNQNERNNDISRVLQLDADPQELLNSLPSGKLAGQHLLPSLSATTDTRACVRLRQGRVLAALRDVDAAIIGARAYLVAVRQYRYHELDPIMTDEVQFVEYFDERPKKSLAALLYHRSWFNQSIGRSELVSKDLNEIRELGYEPGPTLNY